MGAPRFVADESCDFRVLHALRDAGYQVAAIAHSHRGAPDDEVLALSVRTRSVLLTEDNDFGTLVHSQRAKTHGVILMRWPRERRAELPAAVVSLVTREGLGLIGRFIVLKPNKTRIR